MRWIVVLACCLFGCAKKSDSKLDQWMKECDRVCVLSTTAMVGDLVERIGREHIAHQVLIGGAMDPHSYELVKGDDEKLGRADLVFASGLGLEHGASLSYALSERAHFVTHAIEKDALLHIDGSIDPHVWMDVSLWAQTIDPIVEALSQKDPKHKKAYEANGAKLKEELHALDQRIYQLMQSIPKEKRYLVTSHDAFNYFARRYMHASGDGDWRERFKAPEGLAPDGQLGVSDLHAILEHLEKYQIRYIFPESNVSVDSLVKIHAVAKERGLEVYFAKTPLFGDSMEGEQMCVESYQEMVEHNARVIASFLGVKSDQG